jgi:hypothetical protein
MSVAMAARIGVIEHDETAGPNVLRVFREGEPLHTFSDRALAQFTHSLAIPISLMRRAYFAS